MEKRTKVIIGFLLTVLLLAVMVLVFGYDSETAGVCTAFAGILGAPMSTFTSDTNAPGLNREDISSSVTQMLPSRTPMDTIMRNMQRSQRAISQKIGYYQASYKPICDTLDRFAVGAGANVNSPASAYTVTHLTEKTFIYVKVNNADMWRNNDTLLMRDLSLDGIKGSAINDATGSHKEDVMFYISEKSDDVLKLIPIGGLRGKADGANANKFIIPTFKSTDILVRMGQAKSELDITTDPFAIYPTLNWQYCQNFMAQIEESTFQKLTQKEAAWGFSNFEAVNIMSMKMEMELSMLFGSEGEHITGNNRTYFTRGITRDIENTLNYGSGNGNLTITKDNYNTWLKEVFDGNNGSSSRVLFAGSGLIKSLSLVDEFQRSISAVEKDVTLGVDVRKINTYFGTLDVVLAPLFREAGWENNGIILDLEHVTKHEFVPMSVTNLDLKSSGTRNAEARVIQEVSCLTLRHPDCHAIIKPKA